MCWDRRHPLSPYNIIILAHWCQIIHIFFLRKVFSMTNVRCSSFVSPAGGVSRILLSSSKGEQHILSAQAFGQAKLQARRWGMKGSSTGTTGEASQEQEANSGWTVQQFTPTLRSTLVTPDIKSAHLLITNIVNIFLIISQELPLKSKILKLL